MTELLRRKGSSYKAELAFKLWPPYDSISIKYQ